MEHQLSLPGLDGEKRLFQPQMVDGAQARLQGYSLFFAIFPESEDAQRFFDFSGRLRTQHALRGRCIALDRLHITLVKVDVFRQAIPQDVIEAALAVANSVTLRRFPVIFEHALSFDNAAKRDDKPFVLGCDARSTAAIRTLRQALLTPLRRLALRSEPSSTPHMTLLYNEQIIPEHPVPPMAWTAARFALVLSHVGIAQHQWLG